MSEKKAKEQRKINGDGQRVSMRPGKKILSIKIEVFDNGLIDVYGFPNHLPTALTMIHAGAARVAGYFTEKALKHEVDENLNLIRSPIIQSPSKIVVPGRPFGRN